MDNNEQVVAAVQENQATAVLLKQLQPVHLFEVYAYKESWQGQTVDFYNPELVRGADSAEAERAFAVKKDLASDTVGKWKIVPALIK